MELALLRVAVGRYRLYRRGRALGTDFDDAGDVLATQAVGGCTAGTLPRLGEPGLRANLERVAA